MIIYDFITSVYQDQLLAQGLAAQGLTYDPTRYQVSQMCVLDDSIFTNLYCSYNERVESHEHLYSKHKLLSYLKKIFYSLNSL